MSTDTDKHRGLLDALRAAQAEATAPSSKPSPQPSNTCSSTWTV